MSGHPGRGIPSVDRMLRDPRAGALLGRYARSRVVDALRDASASLRSGSRLPDDPAAWILDHAAEQLDLMHQPSLRRVLNATGVVLHTNLGRSVLANAAVEAMVEAASGPTNLELDLERGERGSRQSHVRDLLTLLTGAPSALVVNNCAAAVLLAAEGLARGREVVASRGELIEIGGSFRLPDVLVRAGARLVEVGTTNRTWLADYEAALGPDTALVLVSHPSNYRIEGFSHQPDPAEVTALARRHGVVSLLDLGSGLLLDPQSHGLPPEPTVSGAVAAGFDLVAFSGDKLLGGPQSGLLVGRADLVRALSANPLARAMRVDKLTLAALEATLRLYLDPERALREIPTLAMLRQGEAGLRARAEAFVARLAPRLGSRATVSLATGLSSVGGGSMPGQALPTCLVLVKPPGREEEWAARLRSHRPPVLAACREGSLRLDLRTVAAEDEPHLLKALEATAP